MKRMPMIKVHKPVVTKRANINLGDNVSVSFSSCFNNVESDFLLNKMNFVGGDKLSPVFKHGFLRSEENVFPAIFIHTKCAGKTFSSDLRKPCLKTGKSLSPPTKLILFKRKSLSTCSGDGEK